MISKKYFRKHLNQHHFEKIFSKILQCALASYVNNKNEHVTLAHEASRGITLTLVAKYVAN